MKAAAKRKLKEAYDRILPEYTRFPLILLFFLNLGGYETVKLFAFGRQPYDLTVPFDNAVPLIPATVLIYFGSYLFWVVGYIGAARVSREAFRRFFAADVTAKIISFAVFIALPTARVRPEITGDGFFEFLMRFLYAIDTPKGLFPSLHCLNSWMCFLGVRSVKGVPLWYKVSTCVCALLVFVSVLTTGQHLAVDVPAGVAAAEIAWFISRFKPVQNVSQKALDGCARLKKRFFGLFKKQSVPKDPSGSETKDRPEEPSGNMINDRSEEER